MIEKKDFANLLRYQKSKHLPPNYSTEMLGANYLGLSYEIEDLLSDDIEEKKVRKMEASIEPVAEAVETLEKTSPTKEENSEKKNNQLFKVLDSDQTSSNEAGNEDVHLEDKELSISSLDHKVVMLNGQEDLKALEEPLSVLVVTNYLKSEGDFSLSNSSEMLLKMVTALNLPEEKVLISCSAMSEKLAEDFFRLVARYKPSTILCLGAMATNSLVKGGKRLSKIQGKFHPRIFNINGKEYKTDVLPVFHPDFLIINPTMKRSAWKALQELMAKLQA